MARRQPKAKAGESFVVLAVDQSTRSSGWGIGVSHADGAQQVLRSGVARSAVDLYDVVLDASNVALERDLPLLVVLEDHRSFRFTRGNMSVASAMGMGAARGRWEHALELAGARDIRFVEPRVWRSKVLGLGQRTDGETAKREAMRWAAALVQRPVLEDEAEAICMLALAMREPESLGSKVRKRATKRAGKRRAPRRRGRSV